MRAVKILTLAAVLLVSCRATQPAGGICGVLAEIDKKPYYRYMTRYYVHRFVTDTGETIRVYPKRLKIGRSYLVQ